MLKRQPQNLKNQKIVMQMMGSRKESSLMMMWVFGGKHVEKVICAAVADGTVTPKVQLLIKQLLKFRQLPSLSLYGAPAKLGTITARK
ncbi:hypothetical protein IGI04_030450 [Brassica rapa subsp. trilocularis]|uniref:Uncharacterized protein n=1 Tax=Brassica rapa subsp. trilocularis TaxID=1813537 RepID=A0ABQ7LQR9_BRACM|nr:hypothetical protein IGI04_030450 [Brassica rapa subsp. trilocularis]